MSSREKWAEYRRIRDAIFSLCCECPRPCADCCSWARGKAFGRDTSDHWLDDGCSQAYAMAMKMQLRGTSILISMGASDE